MIFHDGQGLVINIDCLSIVEKCQSSVDGHCIRYTLHTGQVSVRPYGSEEERDDIFQSCMRRILLAHEVRDAFDAFNRKMIMDAQEFNKRRAEKMEGEEERGW